MFTLKQVNTLRNSNKIGPGYDGGCFSKDTRALVKIGSDGDKRAHGDGCGDRGYDPITMENAKRYSFAGKD